MLRVILTTGGTGGHVFPALAVAEELKKQVPEVQILFMGGRYGLEQHWVHDAGIEFVGLPVQGVLGRGFRSVGALIAMSISITEALSIMADFKPDVIIGFGSYASFAGLSAGILRRCPTLIHEQNAIPGLSNRVLSKFVGKVCVAIPDRLKKFPPRKTILTGNPVRTEIIALPAKTFRSKKKKLLVMGGSQGAASINNAMLRHLDEFKAAGIEIWHQTGNQDYVNARDAYDKVEYKDAKVICFIDNVAEAYKWADLVVCRAGASTVAELAVSGTPSVLVPFPYATHNHQLRNAEYMVEHNAALLVRDDDLAGGNFARMVLGLISNVGELKAMSQAARELGHPDAAAKVVECIKEILPAKAVQENW